MTYRESQQTLHSSKSRQFGLSDWWFLSLWRCSLLFGFFEVLSLRIVQKSYVRLLKSTLRKTRVNLSDEVSARTAGHHLIV